MSKDRLRELSSVPESAPKFPDSQSSNSQENPGTPIINVNFSQPQSRRNLFKNVAAAGIVAAAGVVVGQEKEREGAEEKIKRLERQLRETERQREETQKKLYKSETKVAEQQVEIENLTRKNSALNADNERLRGVVAEQQEEIRNLRGKLNDEEERRRKAEEKRDEALAEVLMAEAKEELWKSIAEKKAEVAALAVRLAVSSKILPLVGRAERTLSEVEEVVGNVADFGESWIIPLKESSIRIAQAVLPLITVQDMILSAGIKMGLRVEGSALEVVEALLSKVREYAPGGPIKQKTQQILVEIAKRKAQIGALSQQDLAILRSTAAFVLKKAQEIDKKLTERVKDPIGKAKESVQNLLNQIKDVLEDIRNEILSPASAEKLSNDLSHFYMLIWVINNRQGKLVERVLKLPPEERTPERVIQEAEQIIANMSSEEKKKTQEEALATYSRSPLTGEAV